MIADFFTTSFSIKRAVWLTDGDGNKYSEEQIVETFSGHIQQATIELAQGLGISFTKAFTIWCPINTDVKEGDVLYTSAAAYSVRAKRENNIGDNRHIELTVELDETPVGS
jgi:hypothetical protein